MTDISEQLPAPSPNNIMPKEPSFAITFTTNVSEFYGLRISIHILFPTRSVKIDPIIPSEGLIFTAWEVWKISAATVKLRMTDDGITGRRLGEWAPLRAAIVIMNTL